MNFSCLTRDGLITIHFKEDNIGFILSSQLLKFISGISFFIIGISIIVKQILRSNTRAFRIDHFSDFNLFLTTLASVNII